MATVTELVTKFAFAGSTAPLGEYNSRLGKSIKLLSAFAAATAAAATAGALWVSNILAGIDPVVQLSRETRIAVGDIQALGFAASVNGSSAEAMNRSLRQLSVAVGQAANDMGRGKEIFKKFGIQLRDSNGQVRNAADVLDDLRRKWNQLGLTVDERGALAQRLGLDPSLTQLLMQTDEQMAALVKRARELGVLTKEQGDAAANYNDSLTVMRYAMNAIKQQIAVGLAPAFQSLAERITDLIAENKDWIVKGITVTIEFVSKLIEVLARVAPVLAVVGAAFVAAKIYMLGFGATMAIIFSPLNLMIAGITALILIVDDLIVAFKGGDSVIGNFFKNFLNVDLSKVFDELKELWDWITRITKALTGKVGQFFGFGGQGEAQPTYRGDYTVAATFDDRTPATLPASVTARRPGAVTNNNTDNRRIEQRVDIKVSSSDPLAAGRAAADGVQRQLKDANAQLGVGGK